MNRLLPHPGSLGLALNAPQIAERLSVLLRQRAEIASERFTIWAHRSKQVIVAKMLKIMAGFGKMRHYRSQDVDAGGQAVVHCKAAAFSRTAIPPLGRAASYYVQPPL